MQPINILYVHSHDTGRYIEPYGYAVPTPRLQQLAQQGTIFRRAFCAGPTCSPSRAALLSGQSPHSAGILGLAHLGFRMNDYSQHLVQVLKKHGYHTAKCGIQHEARDGQTIGYDQVLAAPTRDEWPDAAAAFLASPPSKPFFLSMGFFETHRPFPEPDPRDDARYCQVPNPLPDTPQVRQDMAAYMTSARILDQKIGRVLDALDNAGLAQNTLVIYTTDHGVAFPAMKCSLTDHGMGVSLILRGPAAGPAAAFNGGKVCDAMISHIDVFPTLCELLQIQPPDWLQGRSFMPVIRGEVPEINEEIFSEVTYHAAYEPKRAVRTGRYKYIRKFGSGPDVVLPNCDDSLSKTTWTDLGWKDHPVPREQLYDLMFDPNEARNLVEDRASGATLSMMRRRLDDWMRRTNDPLLNDVQPVPHELRTANPLSYSPSKDVMTLMPQSPAGTRP